MADGGRMNMMNRFSPTPDFAREFRSALGCFGTGVTIVTCRDADGPLGITANSFASVSLDPALVLWSPAKTSMRHDSFVAAKDFAIHVLHEGQLDLASTIARNGRALSCADGYTETDVCPALDDCLVRFTCRQYATHDAGDHTLILGEVREVATGTGTPLLFSQGQYGRFTNGQ